MLENAAMQIFYFTKFMVMFHMTEYVQTGFRLVSRPAVDRNMFFCVFRYQLYFICQHLKDLNSLQYPKYDKTFIYMCWARSVWNISLSTWHTRGWRQQYWKQNKVTLCMVKHINSLYLDGRYCYLVVNYKRVTNVNIAFNKLTLFHKISLITSWISSKYCLVKTKICRIIMVYEFLW